MDERSISSNAFQSNARIHQGDYYEGDVHQNFVCNHVTLESQHQMYPELRFGTQQEEMQSRQIEAHDHNDLSTAARPLKKPSVLQKVCTEFIILLKKVSNDIKKLGFHKKSKLSLQLLGDLQALETILSLLTNYIRERRNQELEEIAKGVLGKHIDGCRVSVQALKEEIEKYEGQRSLRKRIEDRQPTLSSKKADLVEALNSQKSELFRKEDQIRQTRNSCCSRHLNFDQEGTSSLGFGQNNILSNPSGEIDRMLDTIRILAGSSMARSRQGQNHNRQFIETWLVRLPFSDRTETESKPEGLSKSISPDSHNLKESSEIVPGSQHETDHFRIPRLSNTQYQDEIFPFGQFEQHFIVNVSLPRFVWSHMKKNGKLFSEEPYRDLDEFTLRRYTAVTAEPSEFEVGGFRLRQRLLGRDIERLLAVEIKDDISSHGVANIVGKVLEDVRSLISGSGDLESWTKVVIGFFYDQNQGPKPVYPKYVSEGSVLTKLGLLAEFPVRVVMPNKVDTFAFGRSFPTSMRFERDQIKSSVKAHLFEFTTTLTPEFRSDVTYDITSHEIPLQCIVCIGVCGDNGEWIKTLWAALKANRCFIREDEAETGAYNYSLIHKKLDWST